MRARIGKKVLKLIVLWCKTLLSLFLPGWKCILALFRCSKTEIHSPLLIPEMVPPHLSLFREIDIASAVVGLKLLAKVSNQSYLAKELLRTLSTRCLCPWIYFLDCPFQPFWNPPLCVPCCQNHDLHGCLRLDCKQNIGRVNRAAHDPTRSPEGISALEHSHRGQWSWAASVILPYLLAKERCQ